MSCLFCQIADKTLPAHVVFDGPEVVAFLDKTPLFSGHVLVVPRKHVATLDALDAELVAPLFASVQRVMRAVAKATGAQGTFVAANNVVSQSVPHLHVHVVPRSKGDGLKGFFWPRQKYKDDAAMGQVAANIRAALAAP